MSSGELKDIQQEAAKEALARKAEWQAAGKRM